MNKLLPFFTRWFTLLMLGGIIVQLAAIPLPGAPFSNASARVKAESLSSATLKNRFFIPLVGKTLPKGLLIGLYEPYDFGPSPAGEANVQNILVAADTWTGKKHSLIGLFEDPETPWLQWGFTENMEVLWEHGYTPFVNIGSSRSAFYIASGQMDGALYNMGKLYAAWIQKGGGRKAFLAPLQEMNINSTYGGDPGNFKIAYDHFRDRFDKAGAPISSAWWVFAPNGYSDPNTPQFEQYYPGDSKVDVTAFSAYNYAFCGKVYPWSKWLSPEETFGPYIDRLRAMAPTKPVIIAQTGTTDQNTPSGTSRAAKDQWLVDYFTYLENKDGVLGTLYFDFDLRNAGSCDFTVYNRPDQFTGYQSAGSNEDVIYMGPAQLSEAGLDRWK